MKKIFSSILCLLMVLLQLQIPVQALELTGTITISDITGPSEVTQGAENQEIGFRFEVNAPTGTPIRDGDTKTITTNIGTLFTTNWENLMNNIKVIDENNKTVATLAIMADKIVITFTSESDGKTYVNGTVSTGTKLTANDLGIADDKSQPEKLLIGNESFDIEFKGKTSGGGGEVIPPKPSDPGAVDFDVFWKNCWTTNYNSVGTVSFEVNPIGSMDLYGSTTRNTTPIKHKTMFIKDEIPEKGYVDLSNMKIYASVPRLVEATSNSQYGYNVGDLYAGREGTQRYLLTEKNDLKITQLTQKTEETLSQFENRIKASHLSWGVYTESDKTQTFMCNFGDVGDSASNNGLKYKDFMTLNGNYDKILGSTGATGGNVVSYYIEFNTYYPDIVGKKELTNYASLSSYKNGSTTETEKGNQSKYTIDNGGGNGFSRSGEVGIRLVNEDNQSINIAGANFKIEQNMGGVWSDTSIRGTTDVNGRVTLGSLAQGKYRLVQTSTATGHKFNNDSYGPNKNSNGDLIGNQISTNGEFEVKAVDQFGFGTVVTNKQFFDVQFKVNGGKPATITNQTIDYGAKVVEPAVPTKDGYKFAGWSYNDGTTEKTWDFNKHTVKNNLTLEAKWIKKSFQVSWVSENLTHGTVTPNNASQTVEYEAFATKDIKVEEVTGGDKWTFIGWGYNYLPDGLEDMPTNYVTGTTMDYKTVSIKGDIKFTAKFSKEDFVNVNATNGYVAIATGVNAPTIPSNINDKKMNGKVSLDSKSKEVVIRFENKIHHHLEKITVSDLYGNEKTIFTAIAGETANKEFQMNDSKINVVFDKNGTISISNIANSLNLNLTFSEDSKYDVHFYTEDIKDVTDKTTPYASNIGLYSGDQSGKTPATIPNKIGFSFMGWSYDGIIANYKETDRITDKNVKVYAIWKETSYQVNYQLNGGLYQSNSSITSLTISFVGKNLIPTGLPTKTGYQFVGWFIDGKKVTNLNQYKDLVNNNDTVKAITLTAEWKANQYTVSFDKNSTQATGTMLNQDFVYDVDETLSNNQFMRKGYTFAGWAKNPTGKIEYANHASVKNLTSELSGKVTLYAIWNANGDTRYQIEHYKQNDDGTWSMSPSDIVNMAGQNDSLVNAVIMGNQNNGYEKFIFDKENNLNVISGVVKADGTLVLKAYYKKVLQVSFDVNGGSPAITHQNIVYGDLVMTPQNPIREGYTFAGWTYKDEQNIWDFRNNIVTLDIVLKAKWEKIIIDIQPSDNLPSQKEEEIVVTGDDSHREFFTIGLMISASLLLIAITKKRKKDM